MSSPGMPTAAQTFASFVSELDYANLPDSVTYAAKQHALDTIGVGVAAAALPNEAATARASVRLFGEQGGRADASIIGMPDRVPAASAAYANGSLEHALDYDDIHTDSRVHTSTMVVPSALAAAERAGADGKTFVTAMVAGHEISTRVGFGGPNHFQKHGFHATPVAGVFGAVACAAVVDRLDPDTVTNAFGIAGDVAGGLNAWIAEGTSNKHLHAGWASQNGVLSADLARFGAQGPASVFEGAYGVYDALTGRADADLAPVLATLGREWETSASAFKAVPACYWSHACLEAARQIRSEISERIDDIEHIEALVPSAAVTIVLEPRKTRIRPLTPYAGKFSLQYSVAAMLVHGVVDLDTYTAKALADEHVLEIAGKVDYTVDDELNALDQLYPGGLRLRLRDGSEFTTIVPEPPGTPANPLSDDALLEKFRSCAGYGLAASDVDELADAIMHVEDAGSITRIGELIRHVRAARP